MNGWKRVTHALPCPVCKRPNPQHRSRWCLRSSDGGAAICPFTPDGAHKDLGPAGYLHRLGDNGNAPHKCRCERNHVAGERCCITDWVALNTMYMGAVKPKAVASLAASLGIATTSLCRMGIGRCDDSTWTFPMQDGLGNLIGIRTRTETGEKGAVRGSRNGLFIPRGLRAVGLLFLCEGPTDTAALVGLDFDAIGRADCNTTLGTQYVGRGRRVVIVADADDAGMNGAERLRKHLAEHTIAARVLTPPAKDVRAWVRDGAKREDVLTWSGER